MEKLYIKKIGLGLLVGIFCILTFFMFFYQKKEISEMLVLKSEKVVVEYGKPISKDPEDYLKIKSVDKKQRNQFIKNVHVQFEARNDIEIINNPNGTIGIKDRGFVKVGKYKLTLTYKDEVKRVDIEVRDTTCPKITILKEIEILQGTELANFDFKSLFEVSDLAKVSDFDFDLTTINVNEPGEYLAKVFVEDENKNKTEKEFKVKVKSAAVITKTEGKADEKVSEPVEESFVADMNISNQTSQAVIIVGNGGSHATLTLHNKTNGLWNEVLSCSARIGKNGIALNKHEGDYKTPAGIYSFGQAFGIAKNPGTSRDWLQVDGNHYWVDDINSQYYNKLVNIQQVGGINWSSAEHLITYRKAYKYAIAVNYNTACIPGAGSAIFLHCSTGGDTAGCISVSELDMIKVLQLLQSDALIGIYSGINDLY